MITLTENAKDYLTDMVSKSDDTYARLSVKGGGCAGFEYKHCGLCKRIWWFLLNSK